MGDGVEEARGRHPACRLGILGDNTGKLRAFLGSGAGKCRIEHARITLGQAPAFKQHFEIGQGPAVDGRSGHVMGGEIGRDGADFRQQSGQRVAMALGGNAACAFGREAGEADRAAQVARHAAPGAVVMQDPRIDAPDPGGARAFVGLVGLSEFYIRCIPCAGGAAVGRIPAGFQDQGSGDGGAPDSLAGPGRDGFAFAERLFGERLPDGVGEIAAEMGEADHRVLGAVHTARQRRHQGNGGNDAHDLPGAEAEAALASGIERAGHRVPDQQEPGQRQHPAVEDEQHVAEHGTAARADIAEKGQHVPRRPVGISEQAPVDGLRRRRFGQQPRNTQPDKYRAGEQDKKADTGKGTLLRQPRPVCLLRVGYRVPFPCLMRHVRWSIGRHREPKRLHPPKQLARGSRRVREGASQLRGEQEPERAHDGQFAPAAGLARPGRRRMRSAARASPVASMAPRRSSSR